MSYMVLPTVWKRGNAAPPILADNHTDEIATPSENAAPSILAEMEFYEKCGSAEMSTDRHNVVREFPNHKYLLMDNARIHYCKEIKEFIISKGKVPVYTIPYTPELNPIENAFSVLKQNVRQEKPKNKNELLKALRISKKQIDSVMSENIFKKSFGLTDYRIVR